MIAGIWANTNLDDNKRSRDKLLTQVEENYQTSINLIYSTEDKELDYEDDPLFSKMKLDEAEPTKKVPVPTTTNDEDFSVDQE